MKLTTFLHSGKTGDIIYSLPGIKQVCSKRGTKARIYLRPNVVTYNNVAAGVPFEEILLTNESFEQLRPLLLAQDFIEDVREFGGEPIDINLDLIRQLKIGIPYGDIKRWVSYGFPEMHTTYDDIWLQFTPDPKTAALAKGQIIINLTRNYRNPWINYEFLNIFHTQWPISFIGHESEAQDFISRVPRAIWLKCDNFNEIAAALSACKVFIGNQSAVYAVAEGLKIPRLLEISPVVPNVLVEGRNGVGFHMQGAMEYWLKEVLK